LATMGYYVLIHLIRKLIMIRNLPVEVVSTDWLYQTTIDFIRVTVRKLSKDSHLYTIKVERDGAAQITLSHDDQVAALTMADILRDIYHAGLEDTLLMR
jgi:hypothetical protein